MIGPGWMPSRPRPLPRARRGLWSYAGLRRRRATGVGRRKPTGEPTARTSDAGFEFEGHVELPVATLRSREPVPLHRAIGEGLVRWFATRWAWVRPRAVPLLVAAAGMFAVVGATKYLVRLARGEVAMESHRRCVRVAPAPRPAEEAPRSRVVHVKSVVQAPAHAADRALDR